MEILVKILLFVHVVAGFSSLVLFWIPAFTKKGGRTHNITGRWYVRGMWTVLITAALLSIKNFIMGNTEIAFLLGFLTILTMNPLWFGDTILKHKKGLSPTARKQYFYQNVVRFVASVGLTIYGVTVGVQNGGTLMIIFGIIGMSNVGLVIKLFKNTYQSQPWIMEHLHGMIVSGIAAHTAFLAFGGRSLLGELLTGQWMIIPWVAPTVIGLITIKLLKRKYARKPKLTV
mgnify:CR=1 FL=1